MKRWLRYIVIMVVAILLIQLIFNIERERNNTNEQIIRPSTGEIDFKNK